MKHNTEVREFVYKSDFMVYGFNFVITDHSYGIKGREACFVCNKHPIKYGYGHRVAFDFYTDRAGPGQLRHGVDHVDVCSHNCLTLLKFQLDMA